MDMSQLLEMAQEVYNSHGSADDIKGKKLRGDCSPGEANKRGNGGNRPEEGVQGLTSIIR